MTVHTSGPGTGLVNQGLALLALALTSCGGDDSGPRPFDAPRWELAAADLRIDRDASGEPLRYVEDLVEGPDGRIHSLHARDRVVRSWTDDGRPAGGLGAAGPDTAGMGAPRALGVFGDTLWVADGVTHRVHYFGPDGGTLGYVDPEPPLADEDPPAWDLPPRPLRPLRDGTFLGVTPEVSEAVARGDQDRTIWVRMVRDGSVLDTVWIRRWRARDVLALPREGGGVYGVQPFGDGPLAAVASGDALVTVDRRVAGDGTPGTLHVTWIDRAGDTLTRADLTYPPSEVPEARVAEAVARVADRWRDFLREVDDSLAAGEAAARIREAIFVPPAGPPVTELVVATDGSAWLRRPGPAPDGGEDAPGIVEGTTGEARASSSGGLAEWWVVGPDGGFRARVTAPADLRVLWAGPDHVLGTVADSAGAETIVRHPIRR